MTSRGDLASVSWEQQTRTPDHGWTHITHNLHRSLWKRGRACLIISSTSWTPSKISPRAYFTIWLGLPWMTLCR